MVPHVEETSIPHVLRTLPMRSLPYTLVRVIGRRGWGCHPRADHTFQKETLKKSDRGLKRLLFRMKGT